MTRNANSSNPAREIFLFVQSCLILPKKQVVVKVESSFKQLSTDLGKSAQVFGTVGGAF